MKKPIQIFTGIILLAISAYAYCSNNPFDSSCNASLQFKDIKEFKHVVHDIVNSKSAQNVRHSDASKVIVAEYPKCKTIYLITDPTHFAFPSIAKRTIVQKDGKIYIKEGFATLASKEKISAWMYQFAQLDKKIKNEVQP